MRENVDSFEIVDVRVIKRAVELVDVNCMLEDSHSGRSIPSHKTSGT